MKRQYFILVAMVLFMAGRAISYTATNTTFSEFGNLTSADNFGEMIIQSGRMVDNSMGGFILIVLFVMVLAISSQQGTQTSGSFLFASFITLVINIVFAVMSFISYNTISFSFSIFIISIAVAIMSR